MRSPRAVVLFSICIALLASQADGSGGKQSPELQFQRAYTLTELEAKGNPPFLLDAAITVFAPSGKHEDGEFHLTWKSPEVFRSEITFPDYHELTIGSAGKIWRASNLLYAPYLVFQFSQVMSFPRRLRVRPEEKLKKIKDRRLQGIAEECAGIFPKRTKTPHAFCFDPSTGYLNKEVDPTWLTTLDFTDYAPVGRNAFPRTLRVFQESQMILQIKVTQLALHPQTAKDAFTPLPGMLSPAGPGCRNAPIEPPHAIQQIIPRYPAAALQNRIAGAVFMYAEIGSDGIPRGLTILRSPGPQLSNASLTAVRQWRYRPGSCNGSPVEVRTRVDVHFMLQ